MTERLGNQSHSECDSFQNRIRSLLRATRRVCWRLTFEQSGKGSVNQYHAFLFLPSTRRKKACIRPPLASSPRSKPAKPACKPPNGNPSDLAGGGELLRRIRVFLPVSRSETTMLAVGLSPRTSAKRTVRRRGATAERSNRRVAFKRRSATHNHDTSHPWTKGPRLLSWPRSARRECGVCILSAPHRLLNRHPRPR